MREPSIDREFGRRAFGLDTRGYHAARPAYPDWVFEILCDRCVLARDTATFEIGAGPGTATRRLLELGAKPFPISTSDRGAVLAELHRIVRDELHGRVTRNMVTSLYIAQRRL
jgi:hypothetical protein